MIEPPAESRRGGFFDLFHLCRLAGAEKENPAISRDKKQRLYRPCREGRGI